MNKTINVSLPQSLSDLAQEQVNQGYFASISEVVRTALREFLDVAKPKSKHDRFVEKVLKASAEPLEDDIVLETDEDFESYFASLRKAAGEG